LPSPSAAETRSIDMRERDFSPGNLGDPGTSLARGSRIGLARSRLSLPEVSFWCGRSLAHATTYRLRIDNTALGDIFVLFVDISCYHGESEGARLFGDLTGIPWRGTLRQCSVQVADNPSDSVGSRGCIAPISKRSAVRPQRSASVDKSLIQHALCPEFAQENNRLPGSSMEPHGAYHCVRHFYGAGLHETDTGHDFAEVFRLEKHAMRRSAFRTCSSHHPSPRR